VHSNILFKPADHLSATALGLSRKETLKIQNGMLRRSATSKWLDWNLEGDRSGNRAPFAEVPFFQGISAGISPHSTTMLDCVSGNFIRFLSLFAQPTQSSRILPRSRLSGEFQDAHRTGVPAL
jgi:hypothetical protein